MKKMLRFVALVLVLVLPIAGCEGMSRQERDTAIGAGVGGVAGSALTNGSAVGTIGGAAVGGIIGHEAAKH
jgi:osmotically inducible lipoprotein OsmB